MIFKIKFKPDAAKLDRIGLSVDEVLYATVSSAIAYQDGTISYGLMFSPTGLEDLARASLIYAPGEGYRLHVAFISAGSGQAHYEFPVDAQECANFPSAGFGGGL